MLNNWLKILPYFIIEYLAKKYCEEVEYFEDKVYTAFNNSYIYKKRLNYGKYVVLDFRTIFCSYGN